MTINVNLPVSRLIAVSVALSPTLAQSPNFNSCLILGTSTIIDTKTRLRQYASSAAVAADFGNSAEEYLAAVRWFSQVPQPTSLQIGRWCKAAAAGQLVGGASTAAEQVIATWNLITAGNIYVVIDGVPAAISGINFAAAANMNAVAAILQTAIAAVFAGTLVTWDSVNTRFVVQSPSTGVLSSVAFARDPTATGTITFAGQPANNDTITLGGTTVTFKTAAPVGNQVLIGGTLALTLQNLLTFLNASVDANILLASYLVSTTKLYVSAKATGAGGNTYTIAASVAVPSGATLAGGTGTAFTAFANLDAADGAYVANGVAAETALQAVTILDNLYASLWYGLAIPSAVSADHVAVSAFIATTLHFYGVLSQDPNELVPLQTTSVGYLLAQAASNKTMWQYSSTDAYAVVSALARILSTNWNGTATAITLMYKQEPGVVPENLSLTQINALEANNGNVFVSYNNATSILEQGKCASGQFVDTIIGLDWLASYVQNNLYNVLYGSTSKIPQTDAGNHILATSIESSCDQAFQNGLLGPGTWTAPGFGQLATNQFLPKGYYVYTPPISSQAPADRAARKSVPFQVAAKLAGAVHTANVLINVNQ